jgi:hypothetical protein
MLAYAFNGTDGDVYVAKGSPCIHSSLSSHMYGRNVCEGLLTTLTEDEIPFYQFLFSFLE